MLFRSLLTLLLGLALTSLAMAGSALDSFYNFHPQRGSFIIYRTLDRSGLCRERCPFGVDPVANMRRVAEVFGT